MLLLSSYYIDLLDKNILHNEETKRRNKTKEKNTAEKNTFLHFKNCSCLSIKILNNEQIIPSHKF